MATILAFHEVDDVEHWLRSRKREEIFGAMGITGRLFTDPAKTNRVGLIVEIPDMEAFQRFMQSDEAAAAMSSVGCGPTRSCSLRRLPGTFRTLSSGRRYRLAYPVRPRVLR